MKERADDVRAIGEERGTSTTHWAKGQRPIEIKK